MDSRKETIYKLELNYREIQVIRLALERSRLTRGFGMKDELTKLINELNELIDEKVSEQQQERSPYPVFKD